MFLKSLTLSRNQGELIRNINFHLGLNLIVDETPASHGKETGNNVGKTTVLKLVDFCLGAKARGIYTDEENKKSEYKLVKDFLIENQVEIRLVLKESLLEENSREVHIERNFLQRNKKVQRVNGINKTDDEFDEALTDLLFPGHHGMKPTFRQLIAHNIRYKDLSVNSTLKNLDSFTRDDEYETLYLFLFGCDFEQGNSKQELRAQIDVEEKFKKRLELEQTKSAYETSLALLQSEISELENKKSALNLNQTFSSDLDELNDVKYRINLISFEISQLQLRKDLIGDAEQDLAAMKSTVDLQQLRELYAQAKSLVPDIQKTFEDLYFFHNNMVEAKVKFLAQDLPKIEVEVADAKRNLSRLLTKEAQLSSVVVRSDSFAFLEELIVDLNTKYQRKGEYEKTLEQLSKVEKRLEELNGQLAEIDLDLFSEEFSSKIKEQVNKFNLHFSSVSSELYGEKYALKVDTKTVKGRKLYQFSSFNTNFSSGKKQGEISCFDIAYTLFADEEGIPCMHFLLNDKKELMHDNQLLNIANFVNTREIQFVSSILKDKLPTALNKDEYIVVKLSQEDKLFRIEE